MLPADQFPQQGQYVPPGGNNYFLVASYPSAMGKLPFEVSACEGTFGGTQAPPACLAGQLTSKGDVPSACCPSYAPCACCAQLHGNRMRQGATYLIGVYNSEYQR